MTRRNRLRDDRGSLPMALLLVVTLSGMTAVSAAGVLGQIRQARTEVWRQEALGSARSGLDTAIAAIRQATTASDPSKGDYSRLPCGPLTGGVGGDSYQVRIYYLTTKPRALTTAQIQATALPCTATGGVGTGRPSYAFVSATGTSSGTPVSRTVTATYRFQLTNELSAGGQIHVVTQGTCYDSGAAPVIGRNLTARPCSDSISTQLFRYLPTLQLELVDRDSTGRRLCIDSSTAMDTAVRLQQCASPVTRAQQWSYNDYFQFQSTTSTGAPGAGCLSSATRIGTGTSYQVTQHACTDRRPEVFAYESPDSTVGAGAAGSSSGQLVNYWQFGRCVDIANYDINASFFIVWPCKQSATGTLSWNQLIAIPTRPGGDVPATGGLTVNAKTSATGTSLGRYCLISPTGAGYVTAQSCPSSITGAASWQFYGKTSSVATAYSIRSITSGLCLSSTDASRGSTDFYNPQYYDHIGKLIAEPCDGSLVQKWNAPPLVDVGQAVTDLGEER